MNKAFNFLLVLFFSALLFVSCEKEPILEVSQSSLTFTDQGGAQTISFSTNKDWTVSVSGGTGWCTISPSSGKSEIRSISVTVEANTTYDDRTATITINAEELSKVITISQPKNRAIMLTKDSFEVGSTGGNISVELSSNVEYDVAIPTENQSWITNTTTKGLATSTLTFAISSNNTYDSRTGKIIIKDKTTALADTVHVTQAQKDAIILNNANIEISSKSQTFDVVVNSNIEYNVNIEDNIKNWLSIVGTKALKPSSHTFTVLKNNSYDNRSGKVIFNQVGSTLSDTLNVTQKCLDTLFIDKNNFNIDWKGEIIQLKVSHTVDYSIGNLPAWITLVTTKTLNNDVLNFKISENWDSTKTANIILKWNKLGEPFETKVVISQAMCNINVVEAGTLVSYLSYEQRKNIKYMKIYGNLNYEDFQLLNVMGGSQPGYNLYFLNLSEVTIKSYMYHLPNTIPYQAFFNSDKLRYIILPVNLKEIASYAFQQSAINEIFIPNGVETIGYWAFGDSYSLRKINIPNSIKYLSSWALRSTGISELRLSTSMTYLEGEVFTMSKISKIHLPSSIKAIRSRAFHICSYLKEIHIESESFVSAQSDTFESTDIYSITLYVPKGCRQQYINAPVWKNVKEIIEE